MKMNLLCFWVCSFFSALGAQTFPSALLARMQFVVDSSRIAQNLKGVSVCVLHPSYGSFKGVSGISHAGQPIAPQLQFGIGSNTKLFTAILLLKLAEANLLHLEDPIGTYLPTWNNINPQITLRQLLNHTSGLADVSSVAGYPDSMMNNPNRFYTASELMGWVGPPLFSPGSGWDYCNTNYLLAGLVAESATNQSYHQLLRQMLLNPINLDSTFLDPYETPTIPIAHPWQAGVDNHSVPRTSVNSAAWSAGAMYSTAYELAQWYDALMNHQVLQPSSFQEMTTFVGSGNYGMGIGRQVRNGRTLWFHGGSIWGGYASTAMHDTATGITVVVLVNQLNAFPNQIGFALMDAAVSEHLAGVQPPQSFSLHCYPNPVQHAFQIGTQAEQILHWRLFSQDGKNMKEGVSPSISVSELTEGTYYLWVQSASGTFWSSIQKRN
jgi:D-alanyl-D-alanine carboxypeptidase